MTLACYAAKFTARAAKIAAPQTFTTKDGKRKGWKVTIPGDHALATPAVVEGKLFIGGGFGSHEFYAFDAQTGKMLWQYRTSDDGPTAAVVAEGLRGVQHRELRAGDRDRGTANRCGRSGWAIR